ncbi:U6 small nuclear RNA (adenine-(43)-N(6))-methyltransferase [Lingula anatina]|uniref:U6 small nuclear RNA (adenine-(43)-N(6))-methyltransferase n=1 Tax=Lingula anatina TaxID=7574 RepID=A0A1S3HCC7_LINAN|nr:U6 small nuclear RNA (adenine-(43)-N(6))-methyltransferase [Lingula anatina]XP_013383655.1 U6 small nuclear RNA (adenine-(43)-N(6))-methyltransferase [Lingula anatina]XP_013383656.1 U6 small nuclear RNA (adenine-(43)-N(6))-methyltransferase [Lingula anatina]|eukprot:XP_013383654.1 U6 small nuclear RNA (adenine-(43)-N(6))-methyltransferase [Lingula anatina]
MALNKFMHPRNIYKKKRPNFKELAIKYPDFRSVVTQDLTGKVILDFKSPEALRALTCTLLKDDFGLDVELPLDRLIPTVPLRLNYILWIQDIVGKREENVIGLDIGAGASCIYPLLGCKLCPTWKFICSEIEEENIHFAKKNINGNGMEGRIELVQTSSTDGLFELLNNRKESLDFCMCNPPFYADSLEAQGISNCRNLDRPEPKSINTGNEQECIVKGGEFEYIKKMIGDSLKLNNKVRVYTTMVGRKSDLGRLRAELKKNNISNIGETEFCQGRTMRWGLAWTFDDTVVFPKSEFQVKKKSTGDKPPLTHIIPTGVCKEYNVPMAWVKIKGMLDELQVHHKGVKATTTEITLNLTAKENTWSHQRKKKRQQMRAKLFEEKRKHYESPSKDRQVDDLRVVEHNQSEGMEELMEDNQEALVRKRKLEFEDEYRNEKARRMDDNDVVSSGKSHIKGPESLEPASAEYDAQLTNAQPSSSNNPDMGISSAVKTENRPNELVGKSAETESTGPKEAVPVTVNTAKTEDKDFLFKTKLSIKQVQEDVVMELVYIEGQSRELMHQFMQYFKNRLK